MLGADQRIAVGDVKFVVVNIVQEHIDAAEVVGRDIDLLPIKTLPDIAGAENFRCFQKQRTGTAGRIIDLVDLCLSGHGDTREKLRYLLRRKIFAAAFACVGGVHAHEIFIGIAKGVDGIVAVIAKLHVAHAVHQLDQPLVALGDRAAQLVAVDVNVVKESAEIRLAVAALGGVLDRLKDRFQRLVQILVQRRAAADTAEKLARQDEKAFGADQIVSGLLRIAVRKLGVVKRCVARFALAVVDVVCKVLGNVTVEQHTEHILLEIPAVHAPAQIVCNAPDRAVQLVPLLLFSIVCHKNALSFFCAHRTMFSLTSVTDIDNITFSIL